MNRFCEYHPGVILLYFVVVIAVNIALFDPVLYFIFFISAATLYFYMKGARTGISFVAKCFGLVILCTVVNVLVNHRGGSVLFYAGGLPVTVESMVYGILTGVLLTDSFLAFGCYHTIMTSEKFMSLTGNFFPSFSLVFSMVLGLVPKMKRDYDKFRENHPLVKNHKVQFSILSSLIGLSLEDSIDTGVSMRYRGYGKGRRTSIYHRRFRWRDSILTAVMLLLFITGIVCYIVSDTGFDVFPYMEYRCTGIGAAAYASFAILFNIPMMINGKEELKWNRIVSKI